MHDATITITTNYVDGYGFVTRAHWGDKDYWGGYYKTYSESVETAVTVVERWLEHAKAGV